SSVNGLEEPSIAKRLRGTPERIELENYRLSVKLAEELEEVPEETQAEHNLSSVLDKGTEEDVGSSSSESEMEEEEEEDEPPLPTSDLGGVPWKEAVRIHALLKGKSEEELEASKSYQPGNEEEEEEYEEEEEEEEEYDEEEEESSEEGEYCPWDRELLQGQWLQLLSKEEDTGTPGGQRLQQLINPADPLEIQADVHWTHIREKEEEERMVPTSESSTSRVPFDEHDLEEDVDSEPAEIEGEAAENGDTGDTGAELDDDQHWSDDIPSDAETELRRWHRAEVEAELELRVSENEEERPLATLERPGRASSDHAGCSATRCRALSRMRWLLLQILCLFFPGPSPASSPVCSPEEHAVPFSPVSPPKAEGAGIPLTPVAAKVKSPEERFFPGLLLSEEKPKAEAPTDEEPVSSPIRSQPVALPEARTPTSPVSSQPLSPLPTSTAPSAQFPICSQPQPSSEATIPSPTKSPIRFQPVPAKTSTPLINCQGDTKDRLGSVLTVDEALKRNDLVAEFWMKSAEIRRSLGLTPVDRGQGPEPSFPSPALKPAPLKSSAIEKSPQGEGLSLLKPPSAPKRLGLPKSEGDLPSLPTPKSPSDRELRSSHEERRD
ncbi:[F-actin]-monooxygenase MICAL3, partial [Galemys pyrenaicus]